MTSFFDLSSSSSIELQNLVKAQTLLETPGKVLEQCPTGHAHPQGRPRLEYTPALRLKLGELANVSFFSSGDRVDIPFGPWKLMIGSHWIQHGKSGHWVTRCRVPFVSKDMMRLSITTRTFFFSELYRLLGGQNLKVGDYELDDRFVFQSNDKRRFVKMMNSPLAKNEILPRLYESERAFTLSIEKNAGWFFAPKFKENEQLLNIQTKHSRIDDIGELHSMLSLVTGVLLCMTEIDSIDPRKPSVVM